jgi:protein-disulfide isomerase/uncharacterized membrane protein
VAPRTKPLVLVALLALLGIADGLYLTLVHLDYEVGRRVLTEVCHTLSSTGCSVTAGRFGDVAGVPVSLIGLGASFAILVLAILALRRRERAEDPMRSALVVLGITAVAASAMMAVLSLVEGAFCPFCVAWYGINAGIAASAWAARDRALALRDMLDESIGAPALVATCAFAIGVGAGLWFQGHRRAELLIERDEAMRAQAPAMIAEIKAGGKKTVAVKDAPSKGADDPEVTIIEFGDFQCPHCRKLYESIETVARTTNRRLRIEFAHYPLQTGCNPRADTIHEHACGAAIAAECARRQDRFWEYAQALFDNQYDLERPDLLAYANKLGLDPAAFETCLDDPSAAAKVRADVEVGYRLDIRATPTFYVNGYELSGAMPPPLLEQVVEGLAEG